MPNCSAFKCNERCTKSSKLTFHKFPVDPQRRMMWIRAVCRKNPKTGTIWVPNQYSTLCSKHFTDDMFDRTSTMRVRLHENAVPVIFDGIPKHLQMKPISKETSVQDTANKINHSPSTTTGLDYLPEEEPSQGVFNNILSSESRSPEMPTKCIVSKSKELIASASDKSSSSNGLAQCQTKNVLKILNPEAVIANAVVYTAEQYEDILSSRVQSFEEDKSTINGNWSDSSSSSGSSSKEDLKKRICTLEVKLINSTKKIKGLQQSNRRLQQKVEKLKSILKTGRKKPLNCENTSVHFVKLKKHSCI